MLTKQCKTTPRARVCLFLNSRYNWLVRLVRPWVTIQTDRASWERRRNDHARDSIVFNRQDEHRRSGTCCLTRLRASAAGVLFIRELSRIQADEIMATLKIEPGTDGRVWVSLTYYSVEDLARMKQIPGRQWNPERKQWSLPDNAVTRKALAEMVAAPPAPPPKFIAVKPKDPNVAAAPQEKRIKG